MDLLNLDSWSHVTVLAAVIVLAALLAHRLLRPVIFRLARFSTILTGVVRRCDGPMQLVLPLAALLLLWQVVPDELRALGSVQHITAVLAIGAVTWLAAAAIQGTANAIVTLHPADIADNLEARRIQTQAQVLARIATGAALFAGLAFMLMTFPRARQFGASLLASAGVAGLVLGIAARSVFGNLLAGLQIALAQPIRIDDVLIVEGEWGRVEEITATYVVLKLWDERRLIVPLQWFIEHPFQNWTRRGAELLGTVLLWVDYALPIEPIRAEARRLCEASADWDRRVCGVQVTDTSERSMQLRILVSSASAGQNFDLRCAVREGLVDFIQKSHPEGLPRLRTERSGVAADRAAP
ncbi:MAG: mechanosensitive ion channel family protein [Pseudomonadota bacterium]|nr:mechanosensitive ion channel family protein [Pseudomonadota bacterium]